MEATLLREPYVQAVPGEADPGGIMEANGMGGLTVYGSGCDLVPLPPKRMKEIGRVNRF